MKDPKDRNDKPEHPERPQPSEPSGPSSPQDEPAPQDGDINQPGKNPPTPAGGGG
jgi:hypothetical protein